MLKIRIALFLLLISIHGKSQDSLKISNWDLQDLINIKVTSAGKKEHTIHEAPANVIVVTCDQIENRGYLTLEEIFKDLPGFDFAVGQPSGEYPTHFIFRGIGDVGQTKVALLIDGVVQNDISNGWFRHIGYNFSLSNIERIELVSGPGSALYGMNALAGYVNIITKESYKKSKLNSQFSSTTFAGVNSTLSKDFFGWHKFKNKTSIQFTGRYYSSQGDNGIDRFDPGNYFNNNYEPDSIKLLNGQLIANETVNGQTKAIQNGFNTSINNYYVRGKINYKDFSVKIAAWEKQEGLGSYVTGYEYFANTEGKDYLVNHEGKSFEMNYKFSPADHITSYTKTYINAQKINPNTGFSYTYQFQDVNTSDTLVPNYKKTYESEGYVFGVEQQLDYHTSLNNHLVIGIQFEQKIREFFNISFIDDENQSDRVNINQNIMLRPVFFSVNGAAFVQDEFKFGKNYSLTTGLRFDFDEFYGNIINPRIALVKTSTQGFNFKALFGQGYKPPTIFELYDEWRGNHKLVPEVVRTGELEVGYKSKKASITSNIFYNHLSNSIKVSNNPDTNAVPIGPDGQHASYYQNQGEMDIVGISLRGKLALQKSFILSANYQYLEDLNSGALDNISKHKVNFVVNYLAFKKLNINLRGNWISKIKAPSTNLYFHEKNASTITSVGYDYVTENNPDGYMDGHFLLNLTLTGKNVLKFKNFCIEPVLKINNLLNTNYAYIGRQSGDGVRPVSSLQSTINNPNGFIPAYHPQEGIMILGALRLKLN